jgi:hypothetical protein
LGSKVKSNWRLPLPSDVGGDGATGSRYGDRSARAHQFLPGNLADTVGCVAIGKHPCLVGQQDAEPWLRVRVVLER